MFDALGRRAEVGDAVTVADVGLEVLAVDALRIERLEVRLPEPARPAGDRAA